MISYETYLFGLFIVGAICFIIYIEQDCYGNRFDTMKRCKKCKKRSQCEQEEDNRTGGGWP